ncbi:MAG: glycosyltransferase family 2 protein [Weeksellaceae bacterium]
MAEKLSAILITLNEEGNIRDYLHNFSFADEIIVVDSFSTDNTAKIIKEEFPHVKLFQREFINFSDQKNFAIKQASHPWSIFFDADERIGEALKEEILETIGDPNAKDAYFIYRRLHFMNKFLKYSGWQNDKAVRLFRTNKCRYNPQQLVHETMYCQDNIGFLKNRLDHYTFTSVEEYENKLDFYAQLRAKELYRKNLKPNFFHFTIKPIFRFLHHYLFGLGFLDGKEGYVISRIYGKHVYRRYQFLEKLRNETSLKPSND